MPDPRPLGTVARQVVMTAVRALQHNQSDFFEVARRIQRQEQDEAVVALQKMSERNLAITQALILLSADKLADAELAIMETAVRRKGTP
jgi:hypothetical protein